MQKLPTPVGLGAKLNGPNNTDTNNKENYPLLERITVENTPFTILGNKELGFKLTWGRFNMSEALKTEEEVIQWAETHHWELTMGMVHIYVENYHKLKEGFKEIEDLGPELFPKEQ